MFALLLSTLSVLSLFSCAQDSKARLFALEALKAKQSKNEPKHIAVLNHKTSLQHVASYAKNKNPKHGQECSALFAAIGYYGTKAVCYGVGLTALGASTAAVAPTGAAGMVVGGAVGLVGEAVTAGGAGMVAGALSMAGPAVVGETVVVSANVIASAGGLAQAALWIEGAATFMGTVGAAIPFPI